MSSSHHAATGSGFGKLIVTELVSSRYDGASASRRPNSWDDRRAGIDEIRVSDGSIVKLSSTAMQSPPKPGWVIVLTGGGDGEGYSWTLYGITPTH